MYDFIYRPQIGVLSAADGDRRRYSSDDDKLRIVEESSMNRQAAATARRHGICRSLLTTWRRQYRNGEFGSSRPESFAPVTVSTKINAVVDENGLPIRLSLSAGQASDKAAAPALIDSLTRTAHVVADRGYDAMALVERIRSRGAEAHIPNQRARKVQRSVDCSIYRQRNLVEQYFS